MKAFILIASLFAIYLSSAFMRLEIFAAIGLLMIGGIGLSLFLSHVYSQKNFSPKIIFSVGIFFLFMTPVVLPTDSGWVTWADYAPTIISGGGNNQTFTSYDWLEAMDWIKNNTPENAVIAAWWDYGYWITTLSDRTTLADNATLNDWQIKKIAYSLLSSLNDSWKILYSGYDVDVSSSFNSEFSEALLYSGNPNPIPNCTIVSASEHNLTGKPVNFCNPIMGGMDADYVLIYVTVERIASPGVNISLYQMLSGGDESKKGWFAKISNQEPNRFTMRDGQTPTDNFLFNTTLGQLLPFEIVAFFDPLTGMITPDYLSDDSIPIYQKNIKLSDSENDPFYLVYASPSFYSDMPGQKNIVLVYKINSNYNG